MTALVPAGSTTVTFSVATSGDDGNLTASGGVYPPGGTPAVNTTGPSLTAGPRFVFGGYETLVTLLRFDTSPLPDNATIISAKLRLNVIGKADTNGRNLVGERYSASHWPIDASDYTPNANGTAFSVDITALNAQVANDLALNNPGSILTSGMTALRLTIGGGQPTGDNYVQLAAYDHSTLTEPQLVVSYATP
jgi:hypothetical protein